MRGVRRLLRRLTPVVFLAAPMFGGIEMAVARHVLPSLYYQGQVTANFPRPLEGIAQEHGVLPNRLLEILIEMGVLSENATIRTDVIYDRLFDHATSVMLELTREYQSTMTYVVVADLGSHAYVRSNSAYGLRTPLREELPKETPPLIQVVTSFWMNGYQ